MTAPPNAPPPRSLNLAKGAAVFAVIFLLSFGLCTVSVFSSPNFEVDRSGFLVPLFLAIEAVCLVGLLTVGIMAIARAIRGS